MLPRPTVLKKYCLSAKFHTMWCSLFVFKLQWSISSQAFHYLMTSLPELNTSESNVFIRTYTSHIYPIKGFLKMSSFKNFK